MKRIFSILALTISGMVPALAQQAAPATQAALPKFMTDPMNYLMLMVIAILLATVLVLSRVISSLANRLAPASKPAAAVSAATAAAAAPKKEGFWARMNRKFINDAVPVEREADVLLDHDYDGIKELDNNLPPWWKYGFYITIIWAFIYMIDYHVVGAGNVQEQEYLAQLEEADKQKAEQLKLMANAVDENTVTLMADAKDLADGKKIYTDKCLVCHGAAGEGTVGPNLTDDYWIHGGKINDIFKTIKYGVKEKGMLEWQGQLTPVQIQQVSSYVKSLHGTNPANPKAPQGDLFTEGAAVTTDSTAAPVPDSTATAAAQ